ncbi:MAG TPA: FHA domain-containing protein [Polyangiaceae bacterium]|nr:FHA domain-containing protein [Polyangiaceae bacterium]
MIVCTRCGASNQPTSKFCLSCGNPLAAAAAPPPAQPQPAPAPAPAWAAPPQPPTQYEAPPPHWQQSPPAQAAPGYPNPGYAPPPAPAWNSPPPAEPGGFAPAPAADRARFGAPEGMNPFGATVSPTPTGGPPPGFGAPAQQAAPPYGPPPGYGAAPAPYAPPPAAPYAPPPAAPYAPPPYAPPVAAPYAPPPAAYAPPGAPAPYQPPPAPVQPQWAPQGAPIAVPGPSRASVSSGPHSHDPSAFAATSPPPTTDEHEAQIRRSQAPVAPSPSAPPLARSAPPPPAAVALGPGRDPELVEAGAIRALAGFLVSYEQSELGVFWPLYQGQNVVGRKGAGAGLDIEIDSPTTSSRHVIVYASARPGRLKVEDCGSTNGTFMNEAPLERGKKFELRDNDTLRFGGFSVTVKII